jgi:hypothetical protein
MKAIVNYSGDYVGYMLINGVAYAVDEINSKHFGGS